MRLAMFAACFCMSFCPTVLAQQAAQKLLVDKAEFRSQEGHSADVTAFVKKTCEPAAGCAFRVFFSAMGLHMDIPGSGKFIVIHWKCDGKTMPEYREREVQAADLGCPR
jgi:hypothetical protein